MWISKEQLEAIQFASQDETRTGINALHINEKEVAATDGHRLMVVEHGETPEFDVDFQGTASPQLPCLLECESIRAVLKSWPKVKKSQRRGWHDWAWLDATGYIHVSDGNDQIIKFPVKYSDGKFPDYKQCLPSTAERPFKIGLNARYLYDGAYLADKKSLMLEMHLLDRNNSALIEGATSLDQKCHYVVMPMRVDEQNMEAFWESQDYAGKLRDAGLRIENLADTVPPLDHSQVVQFNGRTYLKRDLDAALKQAEVAA